MSREHYNKKWQDSDDEDTDVYDDLSDVEADMDDEEPIDEKVMEEARYYGKRYRALSPVTLKRKNTTLQRHPYGATLPQRGEKLRSESTQSHKESVKFNTSEKASSSNESCSGDGSEELSQSITPLMTPTTSSESSSQDGQETHQHTH